MLVLVLRRFLLPTLLATLVTPVILALAMRAPFGSPGLDMWAMVAAICAAAMLIFGLPTGLWLARRGVTRWPALGWLLLAGAGWGWLVFVIGGLFSTIHPVVVLGAAILGCPPGAAAAFIWFACNLDLYPKRSPG